MIIERASRKVYRQVLCRLSGLSRTSKRRSVNKIIFECCSDFVPYLARLRGRKLEFYGDVFLLLKLALLI